MEELSMIMESESFEDYSNNIYSSMSQPSTPEVVDKVIDFLEEKKQQIQSSDYHPSCESQMDSSNPSSIYSMNDYPTASFPNTPESGYQSSTLQNEQCHIRRNPQREVRMGGFSAAARNRGRPRKQDNDGPLDLLNKRKYARKYNEKKNVEKIKTSKALATLYPYIRHLGSQNDPQLSDAVQIAFEAYNEYKSS